ncbi:MULTISPECIES: sensor histidine kinase [Dehalococcoides]|uniref:sensor histidine kinase n=1 Tax=Dehalococcoides TaxID=61434 RepID=UPI0002B76ACA|nr:MULTISPECIES: ATP-binding protein [Dehalococcoides]AGG05813.1 PAS/PAC sensor signal transduction histidine kinase [Dehalococcoides mccartyi DCMB5]BAS31298.1 PAS/PAC sensor signal transduction histidine kinase [Dehalococcoides mccartyi IBARAKI]
MKTENNKVGVVTCVSMSNFVKNWALHRNLDARIYPITNSCFYSVKIEMLSYYIERAILENGYCILNYGMCNESITQLKNHYAGRLSVVELDNCYEAAIGTAIYHERIEQGHIFRNPTTMSCWHNMPTLEVMQPVEAGIYPAPITFILENGEEEKAASYVNNLKNTTILDYSVEILHPQPHFLEDKLDQAYAQIQLASDEEDETSHQLIFPFSFHNSDEYLYILDKHDNVIFSPYVAPATPNQICEKLLQLIISRQPDSSFQVKGLDSLLKQRGLYLDKCKRFANRSSLTTEYEIIQNGESTWIKEILWVSYDDNCSISNICGRMEDITKVKTSEKSIAESYTKECLLRQALQDETKKRQAHLKALVHEIRTPLTPLLAASDALVNVSEKGTELYNLASSIREGAETLNSRIHDLIELERGKIGMLKLKMAGYSIEDIMEELQLRYMPIFLKQHKSLVFCDETANSEIYCDKERLLQILTNLIDNALKYTKPEDSVSVATRLDNESLRFTVSDSGAGVPACLIPDLFTEYGKLSGGNNLSGLGLGLPIAKLYVEAHGGNIIYNPREPKGSEFSFTIPVKTIPRNERDNIRIANEYFNS